MESKQFQIRMNPKAHARLKMRANQQGITIGEMIENLLASFENRLKQSWDNINYNGPVESLSIEQELAMLMLENDCKDITDEEYELHLKAILDSQVEQQWVPELNIGPHKKDK